jgi:hypothetical protein
MRRFILLYFSVCAVAIAAEGDRHVLTGAVEVLGVHTDTALPSWIEGGNGKLRFDEQHEGLQLSRAFVEYRARISDTTAGHVTLNVNDDYSDEIDFTEAFVEWRPLPRSRWRLRMRLGAFYPRISLEHADAGWGSSYGLSASVINTWIGEEIRTIGAEARLTRDFIALPGHSLSFEAATFYGNDPAGALLTWRGWAAHDRQTGILGKLPLPVVPAIAPWDPGGNPTPELEPFEEIDHKPGFYVGTEWQWSERLRIKAFHYDNHADPEAISGNQYAWQTWFDHVGAQFALPWDIGLIAQWMGGSTRMGPDLGPWRVEDADFDARFVLLTRAFGRHRLSARLEDFGLTPFNDPDGYTNQDQGDAFAVSYLLQLTPALRIGAEYLAITSDHCPLSQCAWTDSGLPRSTREDMLEIGLRWQFGLQR